MAETVVLKVGMSCGGCVGAVKRVLTKMEGVDTFDINLEEQKVTVIGNVKAEDVLQTVSKTGKKTTFWEAEPVAKEAPPAVVAASPADAVADPPTDVVTPPAAVAAPAPEAATTAA